MSDPAFDHSSFAKNRRRLLDHDVSRAFFEAVLVQARHQHLLSNDHFTVDGTLLESWASLKSFQRKPNLGGQKHKGFDTRHFVAACRQLKVTPHVAQNQSGRRSAIDGRTAGQLGYLVSQRLRKRVEEIFG